MRRPVTHPQSSRTNQGSEPGQHSEFMPSNLLDLNKQMSGISLTQGMFVWIEWDAGFTKLHMGLVANKVEDNLAGCWNSNEKARNPSPEFTKFISPVKHDQENLDKLLRTDTRVVFCIRKLMRISLNRRRWIQRGMACCIWWRENVSANRDKPREWTRSTFWVYAF
jgi:hypothetical protein